MITTLDKFVTAKQLLEDDKLTVGDVIEVDRIIYSHWVLYIGDGQVVHVAGVDSDIPPSDAFVTKCSLSKVVGDSLVRINNKLVPARERGHTSLPCDVTVENAESMVGWKVQHNLMTMNSEHFVTKWKYGTSWSDQAEAAYHGVFSSSPKTDPIQAHKTMLDSLQSLLHSAHLSDLSDEKDDSQSETPKSPENSHRFLKSKCNKVVLFPHSGSREAIPEDLASLVIH